MINDRNNHSFEKIFGRTETSAIIDSILYDARDKQNSDSPHKGNIIPYEKSGYHRITTKYIKKVDPIIQTYKLREHRHRDNANEYKFWADYSDQIGDSTSAERFRNEFEKANSSAKNYKDIIDGEIKTIGNLSDLESELRDSGYDDRYSSKLAERIHGKKIDAAEAANIINKRKENDSKYFEEDLEKEPTKFTNFRRKRKDARIIRRESRKTEKSEKWYSITMTEEDLSLFSEFLEQRDYSDKDASKKKKSPLKFGDKVSLKFYKLYTPKGRSKLKQAYDEDSMDYKPLAKKRAKIATAAIPAATLGTVALTNHLCGISPESQIQDLKEVAPYATLGGITGGLAMYGRTRLTGATINKLREKDKTYNRNWQKQADLIKVADKEMSEDEFAKKYYKKKENKKKK